MLSFSIEGKLANNLGRAGRIETAHGAILTPAFIPVATKATVKSLMPEMAGDGAGILGAVGAQAVLANTYHLYLQPGADVLKKAGGLGKFMNWSGPTFTDSGGFQAFSLQGGMKGRKSKFVEEQAISSVIPANSPVIPAKAGIQDQTTEIESSDTLDSRLRGNDTAIVQSSVLAKVDDDGVTFKSIIDGSTHRFTPEISIDIQHAIGADIIFTLDECAPPDADYHAQEKAIERTRAWAERCLKYHNELAGGSKGDSRRHCGGPKRAEQRSAPSRARLRSPKARFASAGPVRHHPRRSARRSKASERP